MKHITPVKSYNVLLLRYKAELIYIVRWVRFMKSLPYIIARADGKRNLATVTMMPFIAVPRRNIYAIKMPLFWILTTFYL